MVMLLASPLLFGGVCVVACVVVGGVAGRSVDDVASNGVVVVCVAGVINGVVIVVVAVDVCVGVVVVVVRVVVVGNVGVLVCVAVTRVCGYVGVVGYGGFDVIVGGVVGVGVEHCITGGDAVRIVVWSVGVVGVVADGSVMYVTAGWDDAGYVVIIVVVMCAGCFCVCVFFYIFFFYVALVLLLLLLL